MADLKISVDMTDIPAAVQATQRFERQINTLASQLARGSITTGTYQKGLQQLSQKYAKLGVDVNRAKSQVMSYGRAAAEAARAQQAMFAASQVSSGGINRMGVAMQQTGYQVGDFLVQVQSGTNAFVAFGQQATQLVGILPMFNSVLGVSGTRLIALSAGLGIAIPIMTALAAAFMRTRSAANDAADGIQSLADRLRSVRQEMANTAFEVEALRSGFEDFQEFAIVQAIEEAQARVAELKLEIQDLQEIGTITAPNERELAKAEEALKTEQERLENYRQQRSEQEVLTTNLERQAELQDMLLEREQRLSRQRFEALIEAGRIAEQGRQTREDLAKDLQRETELYRLIARFGEDSVEVETLRAQQARDAHLARIQETTTNEVLIRQAMERYDAMVLASGEADKTTEALARLSQLNLGSFNAQVTFLVNELGIAADEALRLAANMPLGRSEGDVSRGARGLRPGMRSRRANFDRDLGLGRFADKPERGGGGGVDPLAQLRERLALEEELLGKSEAQQRVIQALGVNWRSYGEETVNSLVASIEEMDRFNERVQQQQQLADSIANSFGDAFMSVVDGTKSAKDAFRSMAADIIKELYRVLVVQRMVGAISGALGPGGGAGGFLSSLFRRESGGSMMAGRPYLVGERGPELVIPGRSSTVKNADLTNKAMGGSDAVNVVNNINVTGGTDPAAIRQEVAKLMPQITNATKSAVIDARRRGGQMKAAFG